MTENFVIINQNKYIVTPFIINKYISRLCKKIHKGKNHINIDKLVNNVFPKLKTDNTLVDIQHQIIACSTDMCVEHYKYLDIAGYITILKLHESTYDDYVQLIKLMRDHTINNVKAPMVSEEFANFVFKNGDKINSMLNYQRDYDISLFGFKTLERSYLKKNHIGDIIERPQHLYMRVAISLHYKKNDLEKILETYELLSQGFYTHATPTLQNAGGDYEQLSSCFLLGVDDDLKSIGECWKDSAILSKYCGGIGIGVNSIRTSGSYIKSTQGKSSGLQVLTVFNQIARYADQGGKRPGSIAVFIEPWHGDIYYYLDLRKNTGAETERARDLFLGLMINDIFMERVENDDIWSLMCPSKCPLLLNKYGDEFNKIYEKYERENNFNKQVRARNLWFKIMESQIESGLPYIVFKDAVNRKSNQKNIGVINSSNLCVEIVQVSSASEYAVCFTADTEIITDKGIKKIIECDGMNVLSCFNNDIDLVRENHYVSAKLIYNGYKQVYQINTEYGKSIEATIDHPFLLLDVDGYKWKKVSEMKQGDYIVTYKEYRPYRITSIINNGKKMVYDLNLSYSHNFVANDYIVHNCNLASICLPKFIKKINGKKEYDYQKLYEVTKIITRNLDNMIDINYYPIEKTKTGNINNRPIGIGVQGLADVFAKFKTPYDSKIARDMNKKIFETIYFGAMSESMELAKIYGYYPTYPNSPISEGKFQFDLWHLDPSQLSGMWDWNELRNNIKIFGVRNSLVTACMPTASTAQIRGNNECIEPYTENIYIRTTQAGDFYVINKHLMKELVRLNIWDTEIIESIKYYNGSIMNIHEIPESIKKIYRTAWEIPQKSIIDMAADRAPFIDQSQSMNIFIESPNFIKLNSCLFRAWKNGLKTGIYYLRSKASSSAGKFGIDIDKIKKIEQKEKNSKNKSYICYKNDICESCCS